MNRLTKETRNEIIASQMERHTFRKKLPDKIIDTLLVLGLVWGGLIIAYVICARF